MCDPQIGFTDQRRIVAKVDELTALVHQLESQRDASTSTAGKLLQALVYELSIA